MFNDKNTERDKDFRDKWFHGKNRELLAEGKWNEIDLGDISEHDRDGRVRQGYLAELSGNFEKAQEIYDSIGFTERAVDFDGDDYDEQLLDTEVENNE